MTDTAELKPVAWRVKDYADGWIIYTNEKRARIESVVMSGALVEPLYSADALSSLVRERDEARKEAEWWKKCDWWEGGQHDYFSSRATRLEAALLKLRPGDGTDTERLAAIEAETSISFTPKLKEPNEPHPAVARATAAEADAARMREALEPFAEFGRRNVDDHGWKSNIHREGISVWFGPSEFRAAWVARNALGGKDE